MSYEKKVKVILHGHLRKLHPEPIEMSGYSVAQILNGICRQIKSIRPELGQEPHLISVLGYETEEQLKGPINHKETELHIVPAMAGGKGGFLKIVLGVGLIALSFYLGPTWAAMGGLLKASTLFSFGLSLALGGLLEVLSPAPKIDRTGNSAADPEASKYLGANQNTTKIGTRIPLAYGLIRAYGHYISFDVDVKQVVAI